MLGPKYHLAQCQRLSENCFYLTGQNRTTDMHEPNSGLVLVVTFCITTLSVEEQVTFTSTCHFVESRLSLRLG